MHKHRNGHVSAKYAEFLPKLPELQSWEICTDVIHGYPKVFIHVIDDTTDRPISTAVIDVEFYGDTSAVFERAKAMVREDA